MNGSNNRENAKQLANNTILLYVRLIITMLIALYTSRLVLNALGVEDYGLYNVLGGVVTMLSVITAGLTTSTQRYLSYELGCGDTANLKRVFSMCFTTHIILAIISFIILEFIGIWLVNNYIQIPQGRQVVANWIFQFSVISFIFQIITVPYSAAVISHEKMAIYAYVGIFDAISKLLIAYAIFNSSCDKLLLYGLLMMSVYILDFVVYKCVCNRRFKETLYVFEYDSSILKKIFSFSSWTMLGQGAMVFCNQSLNVIINMFHSVVANAALGIAQQVNAAITSLTSNFFTAFQPQITKSYSSGEMNYFTRLVCLSSKISFFMILVVALPIMVNIEPILKLWLGNVPPYTDVFCLVFVASSVVNSIGNPFWTAVFANGRIKELQIVSSILYFICVVLAFLFLKQGYSAVVALMCKFVTDILLTLLRITQAKKLIPYFSYRFILLNIGIPILISMFLLFAVSYFCSVIMTTLCLRIVLTLVIIIMTLFVFYIIGLTKSERCVINQCITNYIYKISNR